MDIYCKTGLDTEELKARQSLVHDGCEIQLLDDFAANNKPVEDYLAILGEHVNDIKIVHTPLCKNGDLMLEVVNLEDLWYPKFKRILANTCELADAIGKKSKQEIGVIIHTGVNMRDLAIHPRFIYSIGLEFDELLARYSSIYFLIENVVLSTNLHQEFKCRNGALPNYVDIIDKLKSICEYPDKFKSVLDICHAISSIRMMHRWERDISLEDYFDKAKNTIGLIHLAYVENLGLNPGEHGIPFIEETKADIVKVFELYNKYNYKCPITIEIPEKDYTNCINYKRNREMIKDIIGI